MSLKELIEGWKNGSELAEAERYQEAIDAFLDIQDPGSKIHYNAAAVYLRLGNLKKAEKSLDLSVKKDPHFALAFFLRGGVHIQSKNYEAALEDFETALRTLRGNLLIDYKQLGLQYKLYSCEILYNKAYVLDHMSFRAEAMDELVTARGIASDSSEFRHRIITSALESMRAGNSFKPYRLPKNCLVFWPPKNKTEVLGPINFLQKAKVLSSVKDKDDYTGFVGAQEQSRSPSPYAFEGQSNGNGKSPSPPRKSYPEPPSEKAPRAPKPSMPPPSPKMKHGAASSRSLSPPMSHASSNSSALSASGSHRSSGTKSPPPKPQIRPPKPDIAPPPPGLPAHRAKSPAKYSQSMEFARPSQDKLPVKQTQSHDLLSAPSSLSPRSHSLSPSPMEGGITVKIHYNTTRAVRMSPSVKLNQFLHNICKKFDKPDSSLRICYKKHGELREITSDSELKQALEVLEEGFRLTVWAYDKEEAQTPSNSHSNVIKEVIAISDYDAQHSDELGFGNGDKIKVIMEVNADWYKGRCHGNVGIFPKSFVRSL